MRPPEKENEPMTNHDIIACPSCRTNYRRPAHLPPTGAEVKCKKCGTLFVVAGDEAAFLAGPLSVRFPDGRILRIADGAEL